MTSNRTGIQRENKPTDNPCRFNLLTLPRPTPHPHSKSSGSGKQRRGIAAVNSGSPSPPYRAPKRLSLAAGLPVIRRASHFAFFSLVWHLEVFLSLLTLSRVF